MDSEQYLVSNGTAGSQVAGPTMAYRAIFSRGSTAAGAAGATVASIPAAAECRAATRGQHPTSVQSHLKTSDLAGLPETGKRNSLDESWVSTNVLGSGEFTFDEVEEAMLDVLGARGGMREVLAIAEGRGTVDVGGGCDASAKSTPSPGEPFPQGGNRSDAEGEGVGGDGADSVSSQGADRAIATPWDSSASGAGFHLTTTMHHVLNNREVQLAVSKALDDFPTFENLLLQADVDDRVAEDEPQQYTAANLLLPATAAAAYERCPADDGSSLERALQAALSGLAALGQSMAGVGGGLATFFGGLASKLRSALDGDAAPAAVTGSSGDGPSCPMRRRTIWKRAIFSLAVAVFAVVVLKRHRVVHFHRA